MSGRTWRARAQQISAKPRRGATNATSIAVVNTARTTSDRRLATRTLGYVRGLRAGEEFALEDVVATVDAHEQLE
ncbi:MAG TPA: hypothetical protein VK595_09330 [Vicinamibacterales bacterium]|jgi:hypothetical protein|nr:hypothetical protein [Vicinamibacterales bacterium]